VAWLLSRSCSWAFHPREHVSSHIGLLFNPYREGMEGVEKGVDPCLGAFCRMEVGSFTRFGKTGVQTLIAADYIHILGLAVLAPCSAFRNPPSHIRLPNW
jgi:hypothetical protein